MNLARALRSRSSPTSGEPAPAPIGWLIDQLLCRNWTWPLIQTAPGEAVERIDAGFTGYATGAAKRDGVTFACLRLRWALFAEARFAFRRFIGGRPADLFGTQALSILERPWPGGTTGDLLARMIQHVDLAGNFYATVAQGELVVLDPHKVEIILAQRIIDDAQAGWKIGGYTYTEDGIGSTGKKVAFLPNEICHFAPLPDPLATYRGMSWITPIVREIEADIATSEHKLKFFQHGATPNMIVKIDPTVTIDAFNAFKEAFLAQHEGLEHAYKTMFLGGGADATVVGSDFKQLDFAITQAKGEHRICSAAGVLPVLIGLSQEESSYAHFAAARRHFGDATLRPLWRNAAGSLDQIIPAPAGAELWYDARDIPFLADDAKDQAAIQAQNATAVRTLVDAGFTPESVVTAITASDLRQLVHTGLYSVQLQPPNTSVLATPPTDMALKVNAADALVRSGFSATDSLRAVGLGSFAHPELATHNGNGG